MFAWADGSHLDSLPEIMNSISPNGVACDGARRGQKCKKTWVATYANSTLRNPVNTELPKSGHKGEQVSMKCNKHNSKQHDYSFNFWIGCHKISEGCKNCYMFHAQNRRGVDPEDVRRCMTTWGQPIKWQKEAEKAGEYKSVFACSYSDFFMAEADEWRDDAWALIRKTPNLIWHLITKRTHLIADRLPADWGSGYPNVWLGASVELKKRLYRLDELRKIPCVLRWVDFAPTLEDLMPELAEHIGGFGWVCASGETGCNVNQPRPWKPQWARNIRDLCKERSIHFYFSQTGGKPRYNSRLLDGVEYNGVPPLNQPHEQKQPDRPEEGGAP